jgi:hypothetical protein
MLPAPPASSTAAAQRAEHSVSPDQALFTSAGMPWKVPVKHNVLVNAASASSEAAA